MKYTLNLAVLVSCGLLACTFSATAQVTVQWDKTFGGDFWDTPTDVVPTADEGYLVAGSSYSGAEGDKSEENKGISSNDYWIVKLDSSGNKQWDKTIGGDSFDDLISAIPTADGGYLLEGMSSSSASGDKSENSDDVDYWIVKIDADGNKLWDKIFGSDSDVELQSAIPTDDGGYLLAGSSNSDASGDKSENSRGELDYWIVKIDESGNKLWDKTLGGSKGERVLAVTTTMDGGYLLAGYSESNASGDKSEDSKGETDYWIVKIDANGNKLWDKTLGGIGSESPRSAISTADGGYLLGGPSNSSASGDKSEDSKGETDYWIVKIDANGNKLWDKTIGGDGGDDLQSAIPAADGGYLLAGYSESNASGDKSDNNRGTEDSGDYWIVKIRETTDEEVSIKNLTLVHADYHQSLFPLQDGDTIDLLQLDNPRLTVQANTLPVHLDSVILELTGPLSHTQVEKQYPYFLFGDKLNIDDNSRDYTGRKFKPGAYTLAVTPYLGGEAGTALAISFQVMYDHSIEGLGLVYVDADQEIVPLNDGDVIDLATLPSTKLNITAYTLPYVVGSVAFRLKGPFTHESIENNWPYALFGDKLNTDNNSRDYIGRKFKPGAYTLIATPYPEKQKGGIAGAPLEINFTIINSDETDHSQVTGFDLYDAVTDGKIAEIQQYAVIDLDELLHNELTILIHTMPDFVGSVKVALKGPINYNRIENTKPYTLFSDSDNDIFGQAFLPGEYTLIAIPYPEKNKQGAAGTPLEIHFTVIDDSNARLAKQGDKKGQEKLDIESIMPLNDHYRVYPVPFQDRLFINTALEANAPEVRLFGLDGKQYPVEVSRVRGSIQVSTSALIPAGMYVLQIVSEDQAVRLLKVIKQ